MINTADTPKTVFLHVESNITTLTVAHAVHACIRTTHSHTHTVTYIIILQWTTAGI